MTQGDPLDMFTYGISVLLLIKQPKAEYPDVIHPWFADNTEALGTYEHIDLYFNYLKQSSRGLGYYYKSPQSVLIVHPDNLKTGKHF